MVNAPFGSTRLSLLPSVDSPHLFRELAHEMTRGLTQRRWEHDRGTGDKIKIKVIGGSKPTVVATGSAAFVALMILSYQSTRASGRGRIAHY